MGRKSDQAWAKTHLNELASQYPGKYIAIQNKSVIGVWDSLAEAQEANSSRDPDSYIQAVGLSGWLARGVRMERLVRYWWRSRYACYEVWHSSGECELRAPLPRELGKFGFIMLCWYLLCERFNHAPVTWPAISLPLSDVGLSDQQFVEYSSLPSLYLSKMCRVTLGDCKNDGG